MEERRNRQARLTDKAWRGWDRMLMRTGGSYTALVEILGVLADEGLDWLPEEAIQRSRQLDIERWSRRPKGAEPE